MSVHCGKRVTPTHSRSKGSPDDGEAGRGLPGFAAYRVRQGGADGTMRISSRRGRGAVLRLEHAQIASSRPARPAPAPTWSAMLDTSCRLPSSMIRALMRSAGGRRWGKPCSTGALSGLHTVLSGPIGPGRGSKQCQAGCAHQHRTWAPVSTSPGGTHVAPHSTVSQPHAMPGAPDSPRPERLEMDRVVELRAPLLLMPLPWERVRASTVDVREVAMVDERRRLSWRRPESFHTCEPTGGMAWLGMVSESCQGGRRALCMCHGARLECARCAWRGGVKREARPGGRSAALGCAPRCM